jgi:hypothetical protein
LGPFISFLCLKYFFVSPIFSLHISDSSDKCHMICSQSFEEARYCCHWIRLPFRKAV